MFALQIFFNQENRSMADNCFPSHTKADLTILGINLKQFSPNRFDQIFAHL